MTRFPFSRQLAALAACAFCLCMALATPAGADDSSQYPSDPAARTFNGGTGGWTGSTDFEGSCLPPLLCPQVNNEYVAAGDADGNGFIGSDYLGVAGVGAVAGTSTGTWQSPAFTYTGTSKAELAFTMQRRSDVDEVLAVAGNSAEYAVRLVNATEGDLVQTLIAPSTLAGADQWTSVPTVLFNSSRLSAGDKYRIRIESIYTTGTGVVVTGSAGYDNVVLGPAVAAGAGAGGGKGSGRDNLRSAELLSLLRAGLSKTAVVIGAKSGKAKRLLVRVSCPAAIGTACRITAQGLLRKGKPVTAKRTVKVGEGKKRQVVLKVKPKFRAKVAKRKRLLVSERVRAGKATATAYKVRKLIRRR
jgi:hypothetical protein